ncbi:MAG: hypothetical protein Q9160_006708 [Pyrenula sp. 1 TL-2023]
MGLAFGVDPSGWKLPAWSVESSLQLMKEQNIGTTILSLTAPGTAVLSGSAAVTLAREVNEFAASVRDQSPSSFGFFAALPPVLDSIPAALAEIDYALDVLHADGVTLYTRYGKSNTYLGHESMKPVWAKLKERKAVVFVHPTHAADTNLVNPKLPQPVVDYPHETCRTIVDLLMSDRIREFGGPSGCKMIFSHAGGTFPYLATRAAVMLPDYGLTARTASEMLEDARELYYDLALSSNEYQLGLLLKFAKPENILFGSDFPYAPTATIKWHTKELDEYKMDDLQDLQISRGNALKLFPRLRDS